MDPLSLDQRRVETTVGCFQPRAKPSSLRHQRQEEGGGTKRKDKYCDIPTVPRDEGELGESVYTGVTFAKWLLKILGIQPRSWTLRRDRLVSTNLHVLPHKSDVVPYLV